MILTLNVLILLIYLAAVVIGTIIFLWREHWLTRKRAGALLIVGSLLGAGGVLLMTDFMSPASDPPAYDYTYAPANSFGAPYFKDVNWTHFKELFNAHTDWMLEYKRYSYSAWTNGDQYLTIDKAWNDTGFWKINLTFNAPVNVYSARFTFGCDLSVLQYVNRSSQYAYWINYTANNTESYSCFFNWSDIASIPGLVVTHGVQDNMFWFQFRRDNIPAGTYTFDPTFGYTTEASQTPVHYGTDCYIKGSYATATGGDGVVNNITVKFSTLGSTETYRCAIYEYVDGIIDFAGTLLGTSNTVQVLGTEDDAIKVFTFSSTVNIVNNTNYYLLVTPTTETTSSVSNYIKATATTGTVWSVIKSDSTPLTYTSPLEDEYGAEFKCYIYCSYSPSNTAPTIDTFSANPDGTNDYDLDGNDCGFTWTTTDAETDPDIYITVSTGTPRTPTTSDYDFMSTTQDGTSTLTIKAGNEATWVDTTSTMNFRAWAYDGTVFSSSYLTDTLTGSIDGTAPAFTSGSPDSDATDKDSDGYSPTAATAALAYYDDSTQELSYDFSAPTEATSGMYQYYIKIGAESYGAADTDGSDVVCQDTSHSDASKIIYYKLVDNAGNIAEGDTTDDVIYEDTTQTGGTLSIAEQAASDFLYVSGTTGYYSGMGTSVFRISVGTVSWGASGERTGGGYLLPTTLGHTPALSTTVYYDYTVTSADTDTGAKTAKAVSNAGNVLTTSSITLTKDVLAPTTTFGSITEDSPHTYIYYSGSGQTIYFSDLMSTTDQLFTVVVTASDGGSGIYSVRMSVWDDDADANDTSSPYSRQYSTDSTETSGSINLYAYDNVGNYDVSPVVITMTEDTIGPTGPTNIQCRLDSYIDTGEWDDDTEIYLTFTAATDDGSGVNDVYAEIGDNTPDESAGNDGQDTDTGVEGANTYYVMAADNVGNTGTVYSDTIGIDLTNPDTTITPVSPDPGNPVSLSGTASDGGSGVASVKLTIQNTTNSNYWTGSAWGAETWLTATGTTSWSYSTASIIWGASKAITVTAKAYDTVNHVDNSPATDSFTTVAAYTDIIRTNGLDYFVWLGVNTTASVVKTKITGFDEATEHISIWKNTTWSTSNGLWQKYNGTGTGTDWTVHTFDIIRTYLDDAVGNQTITMTGNPDMNYTNTKAIILVKTATNKGYNFSAYNRVAATTLSAINTTAIGLTTGDMVAVWNRTTFTWNIWISGFGITNHAVYQWDVIQTKVSNTETWNT